MAATEIKNGYKVGQSPEDVKLKVNADGSINTTGGGGNASVGPNGDPIPGSTTQVGGQDPDGNLRPISVDDNGFVNVQGVSTVSGTVQQAGLNSFQTSQYTVGTTPVQITPTALPNRSSISLRVEADTNVPVYIGNSNSVSTTNGYPLYDGDTLAMDLTPDDTIWAVSTAPNQNIAALELGSS